jgi:hypothetical protein
VSLRSVQAFAEQRDGSQRVRVLREVDVLGIGAHQPSQSWLPFNRRDGAADARLTWNY